MKYPEIERRQVVRFAAPFIGSNGRMARRLFATKKRAVEFLAKQVLLDEIFGNKERFEHEGDGYSFEYWARPLADGLSKSEFAAVLKRRFHCTESNVYGIAEPVSCCPEDFGFCAVAYKQAIRDIASKIEGGSA